MSKTEDVGRERRLAWGKGYATGSKGRWPDHQPPVPPDPIAASIVSAARALRDEADAVIATFDEDDPISIRLAEKIDAFDAAMAELGKWLKELPQP